MHRVVFLAAVAGVSVLAAPAIAEDGPAAIVGKALMGQVVHNQDADEKITRAVINCLSLQLTSEDPEAWVNFYAIPVTELLVSANPYTGASLDCVAGDCIMVAFKSSRTGAIGRQNYARVTITFAPGPAQSNFVAGFDQFVRGCPR